MLNLSEYQIRQRATARSFERGEGYYATGAVAPPVHRGSVLEADVGGTQGTPYHVVITFEDGDIATARCTCPYDGRGDCKHIVAVLLTHIRRNDVPVPPVDDLLKQMSADQLREVIHTLRQQQPDLEDWFRVMLPGMVTPLDNPPEQRIPVDTRAFRRQVSKAVDQIDYARHWQTIWQMVRGLRQAQAQAVTLLSNGDHDNALALMRIIGEEVALHYGNLEEECQLADFLDGWSADLAKAIRGATLSDEEREALGQQLDEWHAELSNYGLDDTLDGPMAACHRV